MFIVFSLNIFNLFIPLPSRWIISPFYPRGVTMWRLTEVRLETTLRQIGVWLRMKWKTPYAAITDSIVTLTNMTYPRKVHRLPSIIMLHAFKNGESISAHGYRQYRLINKKSWTRKERSERSWCNVSQYSHHRPSTQWPHNNRILVPLVFYLFYIFKLQWQMTGYFHEISPLCYAWHFKDQNHSTGSTQQWQHMWLRSGSRRNSSASIGYILTSFIICYCIGLLMGFFLNKKQ